MVLHGNKNAKILAFFIVAITLAGLAVNSIFASIGIPTPDSPRASVLVGTDLYVVTADGVAVIDTNTNTVTETIGVGTFPSEIVLAGTDVYVMNDGSDNVSVIDTSTNTVTDTIAVGTDPGTMILVGTDLYVLNTGSDNVSVIDTTAEIVTDTLATDDAPAYVTQVGTDLYVNNLNSDLYSVIDTGTNTVTDEFFPFLETTTSATLVGTDLYANGFLFSTSVRILDTNTNTSAGSINIGVRPSSSVLVGTDLYVLSTNSGVVKVIDTNTDTVTDTITVGTNPNAFLLVGDDLYISNTGSDNISVIDTNTQTVTETIDMDDGPFNLTIVNDLIYVSNPFSDSVVVIDSADSTVDDLGPPLLLTAEINGDTLILTYDEDLDEDSVPMIGDFVVDVNSTPVNIESVSVNGVEVTITLEDFVLFSDTVEVSYTVPGTGMIRDLLENDGLAFTDEAVTNSTTNCGLINVGSNPITSTLVGTDLYINNYGDGDITVMDSETNIVTETIDLAADGVYSSVLAGTDLYVLNLNNSEVHIVNTLDNTATDSISVGASPVFATLVGTDLYVANSGEDTVSVIDTNTETVTDTITVGSAPYGGALVGTDLYILNNGSNDVSVIDTTTQTVTATIAVGSAPYALMTVDADLYVANSGSDNVSVIDTDTNTVTATIPVGSTPYGLALVGTDLYVSNNNSGDVSIINTSNNTVTDTISVGASPYAIVSIDGDLYVNNQGDSSVSVIDAETQTVTDTISVGISPYFPVLVGAKLYIHNYDDSTINTIDTVTEDIYACGAEYAILEYTAGAGGSIAGDSYQVIEEGEDGTAITAVPNTGYEFTNWSDASTENPRTDENVNAGLSITANFTEEEDSVVINSGGSSSSNDVPENDPEPVIPDSPPPPPPNDVTPDNPVLPIPTEEEDPIIPDPVFPEVPEEIEPTPDAPSENNHSNSDANFIEPANESEPLILETLERLKLAILTPEGDVVSKTVTTLGLAVGFLSLVFSGISGLSDLGLHFLQLWSIFLYGVKLKKRNRPWGVVYDSVTKQPLDPVYVVLMDMKGKEVATSITDMDGRYGFLVDPGFYKIKANKNNYLYPSQKLVGHASDELYNDLYFGDTIEIKERGEVIAKNIPMDQIGFNWNEFVKKEQSMSKFYHARDLWMSRLAGFLSILGFLMSIVMILVLPKPYNLIIFCLYVVLFMLKRVKISRNKKGRVVYAKTGMPLSYGILRLYSRATGVEVARKVLDKKGNYYLLVANGRYKTTIEKKNSDASYSIVYNSPELEVRGGILKKKFII